MHSELCQGSRIEHFRKIIIGFLLSGFRYASVLNIPGLSICQDSEFSGLHRKTLTLKCLSYLGPFIWNCFPNDVKLGNNENTFKHSHKKRKDSLETRAEPGVLSL